MSDDRLIVSALERAEAPHRDRVRTRVFALVLMAAFFLTLMAGLAAGMSVFSSVSNAQARVADTHLTAGYLANIVRMNDRAASVEAGQGPEGPALVLVENLDTGSYETRIYRYAGSVVQEYAVSGREYRPEDAVRLFDSSEFSFDVRDGLLTITTDAGSHSVALRSWRGVRS